MRLIVLMSYSHILLHPIFTGIGLKLILYEKCIFLNRKLRNALQLRAICLFVRVEILGEPQSGRMTQILGYKTISTGCVLILKYVPNTITTSFSFTSTQDGLAEKVLASRDCLQTLYTPCCSHYPRYLNSTELLPR